MAAEAQSAIGDGRVMRIVDSSSDLMSIVGRLRYEAYRSVDAIPSNPEKTFLDDFDRQDHCTSFLLAQGSESVASVRAMVHGPRAGWKPTAAQFVYPAEVRDSIGVGVPFVESNRFVVDPTRSGADPGILLSLFKAIAIVAFAEEARWIITAVRAEHERVYAKWLGFARISNQSRYPGLAFDVVLLSRPVDESLRRLLDARANTRVTRKDIDEFLRCKNVVS